MKAVAIEVADEIYKKLEKLATDEQQPVTDFARTKLEELVRSFEGFAELKRKAELGNWEKFDAALSNVPSIQPLPGDELPFKK